MHTHVTEKKKTAKPFLFFEDDFSDIELKQLWPEDFVLLSKSLVFDTVKQVLRIRISKDYELIRSVRIRI